MPGLTADAGCVPREPATRCRHRLSAKEDARDDAFCRANDYLVKLPDAIESSRVSGSTHACMHRVQRDEAYQPREASGWSPQTSHCLGQPRARTRPVTRERQLSGLLPIRTYRKRVRSDQNYWEQADAASRSTGARVQPRVRPTAGRAVASVHS